MSNALRQQVSQRAGGRCEYCHLPFPFENASFCLDHIVALKHHGPSVADNLAFACYWCNAYKSENLSGIDPISGNIARLFHPRRDKWLEHFVWEGAILIGLTETARATIDVLNINAEARIEYRSSLIAEGVSF